jgi:hypothetical protein
VHTATGEQVIPKSTSGFVGEMRKALEPHLSARVTFNQEHVTHVGRHTPSVLAIHLSNFRLCSRDGDRPCTHDHVVFILLAANQVRESARSSTPRAPTMPSRHSLAALRPRQIILRPGLEEYVMAHGVGYCGIANDCGDVFETQRIHKRDRDRFPLEGWRRELKTIAWRNNTSDDAPAGSERVQWLVHGWFAPFTQLLHARTNASVWPGVHAHEGSFYPCHVMRSFVDALEAPSSFLTGFIKPLRATTGHNATTKNGRKEVTDLCKQLFQSNLSTLTKGGGACAFEEYLLPTVVRTHYAHLLQHGRAAPPLVVRLWLVLAQLASKPEWLSELNNLVRHLQSHDASYGHVFAIKVPAHAYPHLECTLAGALAPEWASNRTLGGAVRSRFRTCGFNLNKVVARKARLDDPPEKDRAFRMPAPPLTDSLAQLTLL